MGDEYDANCNCVGSSGSTFALHPIDDAYLQSGRRVNNAELRTENDRRISYLKFDVSGAAATYSSAKLELTVGSDEGHGTLSVYYNGDDNWTENNLSTSNAPDPLTKVGSFEGSFSSGQTFEADLRLSANDDVFTLIIIHEPNGNDISFHSSESSNSENRPTLTVSVDKDCNESCPTVGQSCDDGDVCTTDDRYDADCNCVGVFQDADDDGICDAEDGCDGSRVGQSCDDDDVCTIDDRYDADCNCVGVFQDADDDGICDAEDDCDGRRAGESCNDGDTCTTGDVYDTDCNCAGAFIDADNDGVCAAEDDDDHDPCVPDSDDSQCNNGTETECSVLVTTGFENREMGIWIDGGRSARILSSSSFATTGTYSFYIQSNDGAASSLYSVPQDYSNYDNLRVDFNYLTYSVESDDRFVVELDNGDGNFIEVQSFLFGQDFGNFEKKSASFGINDFDLSDAVSIRFRSVATDIADYFILDDIVIEGCSVKDENCTVGSSCEPSDPCYVSGQYDADCNCVGEEVEDRDGDGFCSAEDTNDDDPCVPDNSNCGGVINCQVISSVGFEDGTLGVWNDGGTSARILRSANFSPSGDFSFYVQSDNGVSSSLYSNDLDFSKSSSVELSFSFFPFSMENGDRFHVEVKTGSSYQTIKTFVTGVDFTNEVVRTESIVIPEAFLTKTTSLRFRAEGDQSADYVVLDDIVIEECRTTSSLTDTNAQTRSVGAITEKDVVLEQTNFSIASVFPNPASNEIVTVDYISSTAYSSAVLNVVDSWGKVVMEVPLNIEKGKNLISFDPTSLTSSTYFVYIQAEGQRSSVTKFVKFSY